MWCVAELNEEYIARMEDVLELYEKPLLGRDSVICVNEKPVVLHADVRPARPMCPGEFCGATRSISVAARPMFSALCNRRPVGTSIGIGGRVSSPPLPHHRTIGSASGGSKS
jgi:hypothetical protein